MGLSNVIMTNELFLYQDESIKNVINNGFRTIFSNYDAWYFDCGYGNWWWQKAI